MTKILESLLKSSYLGLSLIVALWFWRSSSIFTSDGFFPLRPESFEEVFHLLGGYRLLLPYELNGFFTAVVSLAPLFLLVGSYFLLRFVWPSKMPFREIFCLLGTAVLAQWSDPGISLNILALSFYSLALICIVFQVRSEHVSFWAVINVGGVLALLIPGLSPLFWWFLVSLLFRNAIGFLIVQKARATRSEIKKRWLSSLLSMGILLCLFSWILLMTPDPKGFQIHSYWWVGLTSAFFTVLCAWLSPWETKRWIGICSFSLGSLFIPGLVMASTLLSALLGLEILMHLTKRFKLTLKIPQLAVELSLFAVSLWLFYSMTQNFSQERIFKPEWSLALQQLQETREANLGVVGDAVGYASFFHRGQIVENPDILLENSEENILNWMKAENINTWLVDRQFLMNHWKNIIQKGVEPDTINNSIFSRLSLYEGEAVETKTLSIGSVESLKLVALPIENFILIKGSSL